ncbi:MAG: DUF5317 domain-containing protein [Clostridiales bacterium]|nr:DUF5317 domain-containing protein [Eubacteriales bacterium]MDH7565839.1 DUF5317 domain-containing protein [Clostridiales bacterium]
MLYLIALTLGIFLGILAKGKISNLMKIRFNKIWIILLAFLIDILSQVLAYRGFDFTVRYSFAISALKFCLLAVGFWVNRHYLGMLVIGAGCLLNALVMMLNGGRMPVDEGLLKTIIPDARIISALARDGKHVMANGDTRLFFLSDIFHPPGFLAIGAQIVSIGDLIVVAGLFLMIFQVVWGKEGSMGKHG